MVVFQRRYDNRVGLLMAFPKSGETEYVTQTCDDIMDHLPDLTNAMVGDPVSITMSGAEIVINPVDETEGLLLGASA
jgi:hypothetical protein